MHQSWVYIVASKHWTLYTGVTSDLSDRIWKHKTKAFVGFSHKYNCDRLVYVEEFGDIRDAISREKQLKGRTRAKKLAIIQATNPRLDDLAFDWFDIKAVEEAKRINLECQKVARDHEPER
ncbi:MAG TPA: GIY-YIG nuclease family protein [Fimbriimonadaceae bacterium]|nr:GIY-YIG nuclease family protein [Fimbriimonadaceae bacterium]